jgi:hypothetical protein
VRSRTLLLTALAGSLLVVGFSAGATAAVVVDHSRLAEPVAARPDVADFTAPGAFARARDQFDSLRDARRIDAVALAAALVLAAAAGWWIGRRGDVLRIPARARLTTRPRAPPRSPAIVRT